MTTEEKPAEKKTEPCAACGNPLGTLRHIVETGLVCPRCMAAMYAAEKARVENEKKD